MAIGIDPKDDPKYKQFRKRDQAGRAGRTGLDKRDQYSTGSEPRVGGVAPKVRVAPTKMASRRQIQAARRLKRRAGTGSMASPQAKRTLRKLY